MDHGIETAAAREQHSKPSVATIRMAASRLGDQVIITVSDDGGGIDPMRVRDIASARNLVTPAMLEQMSDTQIVDLVFAPGFSTAAEVTELSGRGVGMDAVRTAVERIGGRVSIESIVMRGTAVTFTLPFSVMMTDIMSVEAGGQMYGIPLDAIIETLSVPQQNISAVGAAKVLVHRDRTIPVFDLQNILHVQKRASEQHDAIIVIATIGGQLGGIQVDRLGERLAVMLKPLDGLLTGIPGIAGTTIVGDGRVLLILDLAGVLQ
jgi:two-component system chemotaxis sensor kinase CheA